MANDVQKPSEGNAIGPSEAFETKSVVKTLDGLMKRVTEKDCTPDTVNAACNCAARITDLIKVHLDWERMKQRSR